MISLVLFLLLFSKVFAVIYLQIPGVDVGYPNSGTVDVDFLDFVGNTQYSVKGEYAVPDEPFHRYNNYVPKAMLNKDLAIKSIRINSGETGMVLKIYGSSQATPPPGTNTAVPALVVIMKSGFANAKNPITIPFDAADDRIEQPEYAAIFLNHKTSGIKAMGGFYPTRIELQVQRSKTSRKKLVKQFVALAELPNPQNTKDYPPLMMGAVDSASAKDQNQVLLAPNNPNHVQPANYARPQPFFAQAPQ